MDLLELSTRDKDIAHLYIQSIHCYHEMTSPIEYLEDA